MRRFVMTVALTCVLAGSALAGEVPSVGVIPPPPSTPTTPGEIPSGGYAPQISEAALAIVELVLSAII